MGRDGSGGSPTAVEAATGMLARAGLAAGPLLFLAILLAPSPDGLSRAGQRVLAVTAWTATWWVTEALPIYATALLPFLLFPFLGILSAPAAAKATMNDAVYLFFGGFFLAAALERWGLHRRLAFAVLRALGTSPRRLLLGVMVAVCLLSYWLTNTATTVMMLPILLALGQQARDRGGGDPASRRFQAALLLGAALAANIGGMGTPIGTVPNALLLGEMADRGDPLSFLRWMSVGVPITLVLLPLAWVLLVTWTARIPAGLDIGDPARIRREAQALGPMSGPERRVAWVFAAAVILWATRADLRISETFVIPGWAGVVESLAGVAGRGTGYLRDGTVAVLVALVLFATPSAPRGPRLLDWETARKVPWGVIVLLGGGFLLARGFGIGGEGGEGGASLGDWISGFLRDLEGWPGGLRLFAVCLGVSFLTEVTSNTATCALLLPLVFGFAETAGIPPLPLAIAVAISTSCSFTLPVATPPNALVFGTGLVPMRMMVRNGLILNVAGAAAITVLVGVLA